MYHVNFKDRYNPNPISKFLCVVLLGFTVLHTINDINLICIVVFISIMFFLNGYIQDAIKGIIYFSILFKLPDFEALSHMNFFIKMILGLLFVLRMFYLPFMAGKFLVKTSDVGSVISSMDKFRVSDIISIPVAVIFRFFPAFKEERKNIMTAMKVRRINTKNPLRYIEYIALPLLVLSSNIAEDIAKAAETKCIENPIKKHRYKQVSFRGIDIIFFTVVIILFIGGYIW